MNPENRTDFDAVSARSKRLVGYSFASLTHRHTSHLVARQSHRAVDKVAEAEMAPASLKPTSKRLLRAGTLLPLSYLLGVFGFFLAVDPQYHVVAEANALLKSLLASAHETVVPAQITIPPNPAQSASLAAEQDVASSPREAEVSEPLPETTPAREEQLSTVAGNCVGARLAFGLCDVKN
jgi:hypothetical protein